MIQLSFKRRMGSEIEIQSDFPSMREVTVRSYGSTVEETVKKVRDVFHLAPGEWELVAARVD